MWVIKRLGALNASLAKSKWRVLYWDTASIDSDVRIQVRIVTHLFYSSIPQNISPRRLHSWVYPTVLQSTDELAWELLR